RMPRTRSGPPRRRSNLPNTTAATRDSQRPKPRRLAPGTLKLQPASPADPPLDMTGSSSGRGSLVSRIALAAADAGVAWATGASTLAAPEQSGSGGTSNHDGS